MEALVELQALEFGSDGKSPAAQTAAEKIRAKVPPQILGHYDRLRSRGKKGLGYVRKQVCTECHMQVPLGTVMTLMKGEDIQLCGNCGRYLIPEPPAAAPEPPPEPPPAKAKRGRKPKKKPEESVS